jgi:hypothetical protein
MSRDITIEDQEAWVEHSSRQRFATRMLAELEPSYVEIHPVSGVDSFLMNAFVFLLAVAPVLIVLFFALS